MRALKGQKLTPSDYEDVKQQLKELFYNLVVRPVVELLSPHSSQVKSAARELRNASSSSILVNGLLSGKIQYEDSTFSGDFNASISRALRNLGAKYDKRTRTFTILPQQLPVDVLEAAVKYQRTAKELHDKLMERLDQVQKDLERMVGLNPVKAKKTIVHMDKKFRSTYGDALGVSELSDAAKDSLSNQYSNNLRPHIKKFSDEMISELRSSVTDNAREGYRFDKLVDRIQNRYNVTESKAEFLARQETGLFTAKVRQKRFGDVGITHYIWRTAGDVEVRDGHKDLNGRTFSYARKAPAQYMSTGKPENPGEDFNCLPGDSPIDLAQGVRKGIVRRYRDRMTEFVTVSGRAVRLTPNHKVLTSVGWKEAQNLQPGDHVINLSEELDRMAKINNHDPVPTIREIVESLDYSTAASESLGERTVVHFDPNTANSNIDVILAARSLVIRVQSVLCQYLDELKLSFSYFSNPSLCPAEGVLPPATIRQALDSRVSLLSQLRSLFRSSESHSSEHTLTPSSDVNTSIAELSCKCSSRYSRLLLYSEEAYAFFIHLYKRLQIKLRLIPRESVNEANWAQSLEDPLVADAESLGDDPSRYFGSSHLDRITDVRTFHFDGHVYNLETENNWYCTRGIIIHNCRCVDEPILPGVLANA